MSTLNNKVTIKIQNLSSADKTSTTGTITEVKEFVDDVILERDNQEVEEPIGEQKDLKTSTEREKSEQITLDDTIKSNTEGTTITEEEITASTERPSNTETEEAVMETKDNNETS